MSTQETGYFVEMSADFSISAQHSSLSTAAAWHAPKRLPGGSGSVRYLDLTLIDAALANLKPGFVDAHARTLVLLDLSVPHPCASFAQRCMSLNHRN